jgi:glycosyltransferase involved in cell wall biosynthesis
MALDAPDGVPAVTVGATQEPKLLGRTRTPQVVVVMPAYNAATTIERTYDDIPHELVERIILVDDVSADETVAIAQHLGLDVIVHPQNRGYGGNQKTCYDAALAMGAEIVVMLHPDYQYDATRIPALIAPVREGTADLVLGSRFLGDPLAGGMPRWKWVANRFLTGLENRAFGLQLSEYHTGFRAYSRALLRSIDYHDNSDDFVFDQELIAQVVRGGFRIAEIPVPTRYFREASSVGVRRSVVYGLSTLGVVGRHLIQTARNRRAARRRSSGSGSAGRPAFELRRARKAGQAAAAADHDERNGSRDREWEQRHGVEQDGECQRQLGWCAEGAGGA